MVYLFKYDSVHGPYQGTGEARDGKLSIDGNEVQVCASRNPAEIPWGAAGATPVNFLHSSGLA